MPDARKLLFLTTTFYPHASVGSVRPTGWCRHLPEHGWTPHVLCRYYGAEATPEELARDVHPDLHLQYLNRPEPNQTSQPSVADGSGLPPNTLATKPSFIHTLFDKHRVLRESIAGSVGRLSVPDVSVFFWWRSRHAILQAIRSIEPDVVITTSPPHGIHVLGKWIKKHCPNLPWVVDFRDPYVIDSRFGPRGLGRLIASKHAAFERSIYEQADLVIHAIPLQYRWARRGYPRHRHKMRELMTGVTTSLAEGHIQPIPSPDNLQSIRVMGLQDASQADQLLRVAQQFSADRGDDLEKLELRFIGPPVGNGQQATKESLSHLVTGKVPHREAMAQLAGGDVLVCVLSLQRSLVNGLSSKMFEFLSCGKPMIVINPTGPDRIFLHSLKGVRVLREPTDNELADAFRWAFSAAGTPPAEQTERIRQTCSYRARTSQLAEWLDELADGATPGDYDSQ